MVAVNVLWLQYIVCCHINFVSKNIQNAKLFKGKQLCIFLLA